MIHEVEMTNWRAFEKQRFKFEPGINFIMGANGRGKTSILEAISYALTGEPSVVINKNRLLRDPNKAATVSLRIEIDGKQYRIDRTQLPEKSGDASLWDLDSNAQIASTHKRVTEEVERIFRVSVDFLRRIVYMAEGDVFRFLFEPPGEIINLQVRSVIGLDQLDQLKDAIQVSKNYLDEIRKNYKILQKMMASLGITSSNNLGPQQSEVIIQQKKLMNQLLGIQDQISQRTRESQSLAMLNQKVEENLYLWHSNSTYWSQMEDEPLISFYEDFKGEIENVKEKAIEVEKELARLEGQKDSFLQVIKLLEIVNKIDLVPCPICKKPMTLQEQGTVEEETHENIKKISEEISLLQKRLEQFKRQVKEEIRFFDSIGEIRNDLVHNRYSNINQGISTQELISLLHRETENPNLVELKNKQEEIRNQIADLQKRAVEYTEFAAQLKKLDLVEPANLLEAQINLEGRYITLLAADNAVNRTLSDMQNIDLATIYDQIATIWNNFIRYGDWHLSFNTDGNPILSQDGSRNFNLEQFSGGEKTALLIIIHTIIAHHFSKCNLLMIDEPLEHLDPNNRRSLMSFFISACQNDVFEQALITTYEESLVRKYISVDKVNIIYIR